LLYNPSMPGISKSSKGWRYQFQWRGKTYGHALYKTKSEALAAREKHKAQVKGGKPARDGLLFKDVANEYLDHSQRRHAKKTYKQKVSVYKAFQEFAGNILIDHITPSLLESYLRTRPTNTNYNSHKKDLCALLTWAWKRRYIRENPCLFIESMPEPKFQRTIPTPEEVAKLFLVAGEDRSFILVLYPYPGSSGRNHAPQVGRRAV
jgi:hypothetical protein